MAFWTTPYQLLFGSADALVVGIADSAKSPVATKLPERRRDDMVALALGNLNRGGAIDAVDGAPSHPVILGCGYGESTDSNFVAQPSPAASSFPAPKPLIY